MNLKILHAVVGQHLEGDVVPLEAIPGGTAEALRLVELGAIAWTHDKATKELPALPEAVMEMDDDELLKENERLRKIIADHSAATDSLIEELQNQLAVVTAQRDELAKQLADVQATPTAKPEVKPGRKKKGQKSGDAVTDPTAPTDTTTQADSDELVEDDTTLEPTMPSPAEQAEPGNSN